MSLQRYLFQTTSLKTGGSKYVCKFWMDWAAGVSAFAAPIVVYHGISVSRTSISYNSKAQCQRRPHSRYRQATLPASVVNVYCGAWLSLSQAQVLTVMLCINHLVNILFLSIYKVCEKVKQPHSHSCELRPMINMQIQETKIPAQDEWKNNLTGGIEKDGGAPKLFPRNLVHLFFSFKEKNINLFPVFCPILCIPTHPCTPWLVTLEKLFTMVFAWACHFAFLSPFLQDPMFCGAMFDFLAHMAIEW